VNVIQPGSELYLQLQKAVLSGKKISLARHREGNMQVKIGEGTWTLPLSGSAPDRDVREFVTIDCGHLVCKRCGGHKDWREADDEPVASSCYCCKECGRRGGH
jgi:hypothetical protein